MRQENFASGLLQRTEIGGHSDRAKDSLLLHFCRFKEEEMSARVYRINFNQRQFLIFFLCSISGSPTLAATTRIRRRRSLRPPPLPASAAAPHILGGTNYQYHHPVKFRRERTRTRATLDDTEIGQLSSTTLLVEDDKPSKKVEESVKVLKDVAKTRKVAAEKVLSALSVIEKAKIDPSVFLETLGGNEFPGRT
ncbi:hypothetical protein Ahy_B05g077346 isoform B [Arachis hypogaea]|uniref:Uncharacterized protein n=1 Tax=Arachis hypogaea TaxID=3818 RepID=A0A444Z4W1_ARAHY|nr:hypothetical protein Ahy_B05g077346 isoform B [Arachis hypogaea]